MTPPGQSNSDAPRMVNAIRLPGRIYAALIPKAELRADDGEPDQDMRRL